MSPDQTYRFGGYRVDVDNETLSYRGREIEIQALPFRVLVGLLSRSGDLVRRQDLIQEVWGDSFVDAEHGLNTAIKKVRLALGDPGASWLQTVRGRGYRLLVPAPELGEGPHPSLEARSPRRPFTASAIALTLLVVSAFVGLLFWAEPPGSDVASSVLPDETCDDETTLRIAVEPLAHTGSERDRGLGRALAEDLAGALWSVDELRLAAVRTWQEEVDLSRVDYVLRGQVLARSPELVLELELQPTRSHGSGWRGTVELPERAPFLMPEQVDALIEHLTSSET